MDLPKINQSLAELKAEPPDLPFRQKIDTFHLPYIEFDDFFGLPGLPLAGNKEQEIEQVLELAKIRIPHFLSKTNLLPEPRPRRDPRQLHFVREFSFQKQSYIYIFRLHLDYMGGASKEEIIEPPVQGRSASFRTHRLYYEARLCPVASVLRKEGCIVDFEAAETKETLFEVSSNTALRELWTSVLFDEVDFSELNQTFCKYFMFSAKWQPARLFYPFVVDYLTLCLNLLNPDAALIEEALPHFHEGYSFFKKNSSHFQASEQAEAFWSAWYAAHQTRLSPARSGNPHWEFVKYPKFPILPTSSKE